VLSLSTPSCFLPISYQVDRRIIVDAQSHPDKLALGGISDSIVLSSGGLIQQSPLVYAVPSGGHIQLDRETDTNIYPGPSYRLHEPNPSMPYPPGRMPPGGYPPPPPGGYPPGVKAMMRKSKTKKRGAYDSGIPPLPPPPPAELSFADLLGQEPFTGSGLKKAVPNPGTLSETDLLICSPKVRGFCLQDKMWRIFDVECIDDVDWDIHAFDSLVLPEGYKDLILAFVDSQLKRGDSFDDVINGKGKPEFLETVACITDAIAGGGLIIMLSGKPGVGKTLSAESCAERLQLPLYKMELREDDGYISPSDCDTNQASYNATNTRASIERQFELVTKWNAVLLVDECDAFLQKRSRGDPKRNEVMSSMNEFIPGNSAKVVELTLS
jgi:hypothetical protein